MITRLTIQLLLIASFVASGQTVTITTNADDSRPIDTIIQKIEKLSGKPINYEDLIYSNSADTIDVTRSVLKSPKPTDRLIVPRGGVLSLTIPVDSVTQTIVGSVGTASALNALMAVARSSPVVAGQFKVEAFTVDAYNDGFFVVPTHSRSQNNDMVAVKSALSVEIDLPGVRQTAFETLRAISSQVSKKIGTTLSIGTIPIKAFAITDVQLAASGEPASRTLARLFAAVSNSGGAPPGHAGMSYHAYFDPVAKYYVLNIHSVNDPRSPPVSVVPPLQAPRDLDSRLGKKQ